MKRLTYRQAPAHIRGAIREAAVRWETTDGTPLLELLDEPVPDGPVPFYPDPIPEPPF